MCGFNGSVMKYSRGLVLPSFIFKTMSSLAIAESRPFDQLAVFNGGSFLNDNEIPSDFRSWLTRKIASEVSIKEFFIETRCEYIEENEIRRMVEALRGKRLIVAIGLESRDDRIRNGLIRKGLSLNDFEAKVSLLRACGAFPYAYVFLKPAGISEGKALNDAIETVSYASSVGVAGIELSCAFVQPNTEMEVLYRQGSFTPPWLWSVLRVIEMAKKEDLPLQIGSFSDEPPPIAAPFNCKKCSPQILKAIEEYRLRGEMPDVPKCACKEEWRISLKQ